MAAVIVALPAEFASAVQEALHALGFRRGRDDKWRGDIDARRSATIERQLGITLDDAGPTT